MKKILWVILLYGIFTGGGYAQNRRDSVQIDRDVKLKYKFHYAEGLREKMLGHQDEALTHFEICLETAPDSTAPMYELANVYKEQKKYSLARTFASDAWKIKPKQKWYGQLLAEIMIKTGDYAEAAGVYGTLYKLYPDQNAYLFNQIDLLSEVKQYKKALKITRKYEKDSELERWALLKEHVLYQKMNKGDKGRKKVFIYLKYHPEDIEARGILAESLAGAKELIKAEEQYKILKEKDPDNPAVRFSYAQFLFDQNRKKEALKEYLVGFKSGDVNPLIKIQIVMGYLNKQTQQDSLGSEVVQLLDTLYRYEHGEPEVDALYANYLFEKEKYREAEPVFARVLAKQRNDFTTWQNQLFTLNALEEWSKMAATAEQALEVFPNQPLFYLMKGVALTQIQKWDEAIKALKTGLKFPTSNTELNKQFYLSLADAYYKNGNSKEAFGYFEDLLTFDADNVIALNNYSYYLALNNEKLDHALEMIRKCVTIEKDNPTYLDTYAWVLYQKKLYAKALTVIEKVMKLDPKPTVEVVSHYGDILLANGLKERAVKAWEKALKIDPDFKGLKKKIEEAEK
ncbi:MAG: tetratricopeptide repeat protein [Bacteroidales bacterium]|nr:tetratricopeptide repeat protein [Bacteroidales bacterium]